MPMLKPGTRAQPQGLRTLSAGHTVHIVVGYAEKGDLATYLTKQKVRHGCSNHCCTTSYAGHASSLQHQLARERFCAMDPELCASGAPSSTTDTTGQTTPTANMRYASACAVCCAGQAP